MFAKYELMKIRKIFPSRWDIAIQSREVILKSDFAFISYR